MIASFLLVLLEESSGNTAHRSWETHWCCCCFWITRSQQGADQYCNPQRIWFMTQSVFLCSNPCISQLSAHHYFVSSTELKQGRDLLGPPLYMVKSFSLAENSLWETCWGQAWLPQIFVWRHPWLSGYLRIEAKGLCQPLPDQKVQGVWRRQAKIPPEEENAQKYYERGREKCQKFH